MDSYTSSRAAAVGVVAVSVLLFAEALLVLGGFLWLLFSALSTPASSVMSGIAITVLAGIATLWLAALAVGSLRRRSWVRAGAITWQVLQIAVAVGCFQGLFGRGDIGFLLLIPALAVIGLLLWPRVGEVFARRG